MVRRSQADRRRRGLAAAIRLIFIVVAAGCASSGPAPGGLGVGDRLFPTLGNTGYDVTRYGLDFDIEQLGKPFEATATIDATATRNLSRFSFDLSGNTVAHVTVDRRRATFTRDQDKLVVTPATPIGPGRPFRVVVRYRVKLRDHKSHSVGLNFKDGFALDAQPDGAHSLFPCNDHPSDKALFTVRLVVPEGLTAVANGMLDNEQRVGDRTAFIYTSRHPMATELIQVVVGPYTIVPQTGPHGLTLRHVLRSDQVGELTPIVERTAEQIAWLERWLGPYPFQVYGVAVVPSYREEGLETQTLALFDSSYISGDREKADPLMVHELAHQWFGDSVTPRTWSDLWLNEAHATWYEWLYATEHGWRPTGGKADNFIGRMRETYASGDRWRKQYGPVARPKSAKGLFNDNVYDGGALVLYALHEKVGAAKFDRIERSWVSAHRDGVAQTSDFIDLASRVVGQDLTGFLEDWLYGTKTPPMPGHPDWRVEGGD